MRGVRIGRLCGASLVFVAACSAAATEDDDAETPEPVVDAGDAALSSSSGASGRPPTADAARPDARADAATDADAAMPDCVVMGVGGDCVETAECAARDEHRSTAGHCEGAETVQCCTPFGLALCDPEVIALPNAGRTSEAAGEDGCPPGMIGVTTFCIDKFEASLVHVADGSSWSPYLNPGATPVRAVSVEGAVPQGYIDGDRAADACAAAGKRLCTDAEWLRACRGPEQTTYPYGDTLELGRCNDHRDQHPAVQYFGTTDPEIYSMIDNACLNQLPISVDPAGARGGCVSAEGAFDLMGNLHEWTANPAGTFRGGFYVDTELNGPGCLYATTAHDTGHWDYSTGFRCCAD